MQINTGDDKLSGGSGDDIIWGQRGHDTLHGNAGNDELIGGLGDDVIYGGAGHDIILGDTGSIVRAYVANSTTPLQLTPNRWHKNVILEDIAHVNGIINTTNAKTDGKLLRKLKRNSLTELGSMLNSSVVISMAAFNTGGDKIKTQQIKRNPGQRWYTAMLLLDLEVPGNDKLDGGSGEDLVIGQGGDDKVSGGADEDIVVGDRMYNMQTYQTKTPHVFNTFRILRNPVAANLNITLDYFGTVIMPPHRLDPVPFTLETGWSSPAPVGDILPLDYFEQVNTEKCVNK